ncbi:MAG: 30S ribosomal protein S6 [Oscillospiraceae bacterium]|nr:30S ribosomal protein S6 [Oscillospiraceae bacterium]
MAQHNYEAMMVFSMLPGEEAINALKERFQTLIEQNGTLDAEQTKDMGKRRLAYLINKRESEGYYMLFVFTSAPEFPAELERVAGITDGVLRCMVIRREG